MIKAKLINHLQELESIRRDNDMTQDVHVRVIELQKLLTDRLVEELNKPDNFKENNIDPLLSELEKLS